MSRLTVYPTLDEYERKLPDLADRLSGINADKLKKMARVWVGKDAYKLNKESAIQTLKRCFRDPKAIRRLVENLTAAERDGLMLMKLRGRSVVYTEELAAELLLLHPIPFNPGRSYYSGDGKHYARLNEMIERGLLMRCDGKNDTTGSYYSSYVCEAVGLVADFSEIIEVAPPPALSFKPAPEAVAPIAQRTGELILQMTAFAQAFDRLGGVQLTAKGQYATPSLNKLNKLLGWGKQDKGRNDGENDQTSLLPSVEFYLALFVAADLLRVNHAAREIGLNPQASIQETLELPLDLQAPIWARAYRSLRRWKEYSSSRGYYYDEDDVGQTKHNALRAALLLALGMLPDPAAWYRIADLSEVLRQRIGGHFALGYLPTYSAPWQATAEQEAAARAKYEVDHTTRWRASEGVWIEYALDGPLFHLGLVELAREPRDKSDEPTLFRLTEAGRAALRDIFRQPVEKKSAAPRAALSERPCWVVQPNFEVIVYLDHASPRQLGFIERIGVRQKADAAIVTYRLTRESVYAALEEGVEAKQLLQTLETGSQHPLPPGVARTLGDWAARRERLAVRINASVLEFPDAAARDAALTSGKIKGASVGERFILTGQSEQALKRALRLGAVISYDPIPPHPLEIKDDGEVRINPARRDLLIAGELAAVAEATEDPLRWRITRESVLAARSRGRTAGEIIDRLENRAAVQAMPLFLRYAIQGWLGDKSEPGPMALATAPFLQTANAELADAIWQCGFLRAHLLARIGGRAMLVKPESVKELRKLLDEYGFEPGKEVLLPAQPEKKK
ncbi:MAG: helicase-associated domain-containing protein [Blastocatellia bacterium]